MVSRVAKKRPSVGAAAGRLNKERIVAAALRQIDSGGLAAFSLRNVATELGVYPTAVYWYVKGREELLGLVVSHAIRDVLPPTASVDWRSWLREMCHRYRRAIQRHPNIAGLIGSQLRSNAGLRADLVDGVLSTLSSAGFSDEKLVDAYNVIVGATVGFVSQEFAALPSENLVKWAEGHRKRISTLDVMQHQTLARLLPKLANKAFILRWTNGTECPLDTSFGLFIDVLINGLELALRATAD